MYSDENSVCVCVGGGGGGEGGTLPYGSFVDDELAG